MNTKTMNQNYINIDERYGEAVPVSLADYVEINPHGNFTQDEYGIHELLHPNARAPLTVALPADEYRRLLVK